MGRLCSASLHEPSVLVGINEPPGFFALSRTSKFDKNMLAQMTQKMDFLEVA